MALVEGAFLIQKGLNWIRNQVRLEPRGGQTFGFKYSPVRECWKANKTTVDTWTAYAVIQAQSMDWATSQRNAWKGRPMVRKIFEGDLSSQESLPTIDSGMEE